MTALVALVFLLGSPLHPPLAAGEDESARVKSLIQELGSDEIETRQAAQKELAAMGRRIESILKEEEARATDSEIKARLAALIEELSWGDAVNGLRMRIAATAEVRIGEEFILQALIQNASDKEQVFSDWVPYDVSLYTVHVLDKTSGTTVHWQDQMRGYDKHFIRGWQIPPGGSHEASIRLHEGTFTPALVGGHVLEVRVSYSLTAHELCLEEGPLPGEMTSGPLEVRVAP